MFFIFCCLLAVLFSDLQRTRGQAVIVEGRSPPYPLHNNVTLNCTTSLQGNIIWSVNEYQLNNERRLVIWQAQGVIVQPIRPTLSIVTITSQTRFNNTRFRCEVEGPGALDGIIGMSEFINFIIYGIPSTPTDLVVSVNLSLPGIQLSWTPGFTLDNEAVSYLVTFSSSQMPDLLVTSPSAIIPSVGRCPRYTVTIQALNEVGRSNGSLQTVQVAPSGLAEFKNVETRVQLASDMAFLSVNFTDPSPCSDFGVLEYDLRLSEVMNSGSGAVNISAPLTLASVNFESQGSEVSIMVNTSSGLLPDRIYSVDVVARSAVNAVNTSFSVYTTGLQASSISVDSSIINATCFFTEGSTSRGCQILSGDSTILLMISLSRGEVVAMGTAPFIFGLLTENIVAVEILENGDQSEIRVSPAMVVSFPTTTTTQPTKAASVASPTSLLPAEPSGGVALEGNLLYVVIGIIVAVILFLLIIIFVIIIIIRNTLVKKSRAVDLSRGEELKNNYVYGANGVSAVVCDTSEFTNSENGKLALSNTYDTADVLLINDSNGKASAPIPTYATVDQARKETFLSGGPAVLNPVYGPGSALSQTASPSPVPLANSQKAVNPIYSEAYASVGKQTPQSDMKQVPIVSGLNPVYDGVGSVGSSLHSHEGNVSPRYTSNSPHKSASFTPAFPPSQTNGQTAASSAVPLYEELKPVKLQVIPSQDYTDHPPLSSGYASVAASESSKSPPS